MKWTHISISKGQFQFKTHTQTLPQLSWRMSDDFWSLKKPDFKSNVLSVRSYWRRYINVVVQLIYYSIDVNGKFITFRKIKWLPICLCSHDITEILLKVALSTINHINQTPQLSWRMSDDFWSLKKPDFKSNVLSVRSYWRRYIKTTSFMLLHPELQLERIN
jgi:hypothetical protein